MCLWLVDVRLVYCHCRVAPRQPKKWTTWQWKCHTSVSSTASSRMPRTGRPTIPSTLLMDRWVTWTFWHMNPHVHTHTHTEGLAWRVVWCYWNVCDHCLLHQVICKVSFASVEDVDRAVAAAKEAYEFGPWGKMNPRDRGSLLYKWVAPPRGLQWEYH